MSNPSTNIRSGLDGYSRPRLATRAEKANFPASLKDSEYKVQATTFGNGEILLANQTTMELIWFDYSMISAADRRSSAATTKRKITGGTLADDLVIARERQLGIVRPQGTTAAVPAAPTQQPHPVVAAPTIAATATTHQQLPSVVQQTAATTAPAGPQTRSATRVNDALASLAGLSIHPAPAVAPAPVPAPAPAPNPANDRTGWAIQQIRGEEREYYLVQYAKDPSGMPRQPAQEWVHWTLVNNSVLHEWFKKKAGSLAQTTEIPPFCARRAALAARPAPVPAAAGPSTAPVLATAGPSTAPVASDPEQDVDMDYDDMEDAEGEEVPESDHQWYNY
ncbi:hypothetical protein MBLNU457_g3036t1 [Dothideomycetes sp. NU457]